MFSLLDAEIKLDRIKANSNCVGTSLEHWTNALGATIDKVPNFRYNGSEYDLLNFQSEICMLLTGHPFLHRQLRLFQYQLLLTGDLLGLFADFHKETTYCLQILQQHQALNHPMTWLNPYLESFLAKVRN